MRNYLSEPWAILPESFVGLLEMMQADLPSIQPNPTNPVPYTLTDGLATVPLHGPITRILSDRDKARMAYFGTEATASAELRQTLRELHGNPSVHSVLLDIDSPGGSVNGTPELAATVRDLCKDKHVYAYTSGLCCSAAYWVASQCDAIYAAPSARVGSIGVLLPLLDTSGLYNKSGLKMDVISAGKYKATGVPGTALTEDQRLLLQAQVNATWETFKTAVNERRTIDEAHMEGQTFTGEVGVHAGLVDACANSIDLVQEKILRRHARRL